jgi:heme-degrading monooxygenase HmoA
MYARLNTLTGVNDIDAAVAYLQEVALSVVQQQRGYQGTTASGNRETGQLGILTVWETAADREASESALSKLRDEARDQLATGLTVELFEQRTRLISQPPTVGNSLMVTRISMDPARIDEINAYVEREIVPKVTALAGFRSLRTLVNPQTGEGVVGSVWDNDQALKAASEAALDLRPEIVANTGITFGDRTYGELVFIDLR